MEKPEQNSKPEEESQVYKREEYAKSDFWEKRFKK